MKHQDHKREAATYVMGGIYGRDERYEKGDAVTKIMIQACATSWILVGLQAISSGLY